MEPSASILVTFGIPALALGVVLLVLVAVHRTSGPRAALAGALLAGAWLAITGAAAAQGLFARFEARPPPLVLLLAPTLLGPLALGLSPIGERLARGLPLAALIGFHAFRLPLELLMHQAAREGVMPMQMSFEGWNFDVLSGLGAVVAAVVGSSRLALAWNLLASALLAAIVGIAVASLPVFHAFGDAPSALNTWVAYFPFVWLPAALVASALLGHVVLWRRLLGVSAAPRPA